MMRIFTWIIQILLAIAFLGAGLMKLMTPYPELAGNPDMAWVNDFTATQIRVISVLEVLGAIGLILPMFVSRLRVLVPVAATGLALVMVGAVITHAGRDEPFIINLILLVLAFLTLWLRRGFFRPGRT